MTHELATMNDEERARFGVELARLEHEKRPATRPLDEVEETFKTFVSYPSEAARVAHTLWTAHTHLMDAWESTPRIAFLSPEPASSSSPAKA